MEPKVGVALHPDNPRYFSFRGTPLVLLTATEHYGSVLNRSFNFEPYLDDLVDKKMTMTRTFLLFRELEAPTNPLSPCKPRPEDYIAPWPRTGPEKALDGQPIFDLDQWNEEYFERLHRFLDSASRHGIVVELTLFSNTYGEPVWALNPLRAENNKQKIGNIQWADYNSLRDQRVVDRQIAHARKIVQETHPYDNVYYEICNEPGGGVEGHAMPAEVDEWQREMARIVREELAKAKTQRLIIGSQAFSYTPKFHQPLDESFSGDLFQGVNVHPLPDTILQGRTYHLGNIMSKELKLAEMRDFFLAAAKVNKPVISDEDNAASMYREDIGWTIHRKRAWMTLLCGGHYDFIDFSLQIGCETGTEQSGRKLRTWFRYLSEVIHQFDFINARPMPELLRVDADDVVGACLAVEGLDYLVYLADGREVTDPSAGEEISGRISLALPPRRFRISFYSPVSGHWTAPHDLEGGGDLSIDIPPFEHDLVIRASLYSLTRYPGRGKGEG